MPNKIPVVAAIPNYNMAEQLDNLLPQVIEQGYEGIYVLDDASTDHSVDIVRNYSDDVRLVRSRENRGAGANRNQIIEHVGDTALIHFIDADMDLVTPEAVSVARETVERYAPKNVGVVGGLVSRADGSQEPYNFGPAFALRTNLTAGLPLLIDKLRGKPELAARLQRVGKSVMKDWPNVLVPPVPAETYWLHEGNMLVYASIFRTIGGYDPKQRAHETQDLSIRLEKRGIKRQFDPSIEVIHHYVDVRGKSRSSEQNKAMLYMLRKHGLKNWVTGDYS